MLKIFGIRTVGIDMEKRESVSLYDFKRCITCDAYGYKTADDWKYGRKFCFVHKVYIGKASEMVCRDWKPTD